MAVHILAFQGQGRVRAAHSEQDNACRSMIDHMDSVLQDILSSLTAEHSAALQWFVAHEGSIGARPWRKHGESVVPGVTIPIVAMRGIHQPEGWSMAISITATASSAYMDGIPTALGDGTWALPYRAHAGGDGKGLDSRWNRALLANKLNRVPVGVFLPAKGGQYLNLGLAMVEDYYEDQGAFLLRGPVRWTQGTTVWGRAPEPSRQLPHCGEDENSLDDPAPALVRRRKDQDRFRRDLLAAYDHRCAASGYDTDVALQAAHILSYRGRSSQDVTNGILLRADIHLLYDHHLLSVDPDECRIWLAKELRSTAYGELHRQSLKLPVDTEHHPNPERLAVHWAVFGTRAG